MQYIAIYAYIYIIYLFKSKTFRRDPTGSLIAADTLESNGEYFETIQCIFQPSQRPKLVPESWPKVASCSSCSCRTRSGRTSANSFLNRLLHTENAFSQMFKKGEYAGRCRTT